MNKVILLGNITHELELKYTQSTNKPVCTFSIAINKEFGEGADFFTVQAWNNTATFLTKYFKKGSRIALVGRLQNREWMDDNNNKHKVTEIVAESIDFAEKKEKLPEEVNVIETPVEDDDLPF